MPDINQTTANVINEIVPMDAQYPNSSSVPTMTHNVAAALAIGM